MTAPDTNTNTAMVLSFRRGNDELRDKLIAEQVPPAAARVLSSRDITCRDDIVPPVSSLLPPDFLETQAQMCDLLQAAIEKGDKICVIGDYDADGMSATALTVGCLQRLGAQVSWRIPERVRHGYGLHVEMVEEAARDGVKMLLTVDNGVSANDAVAQAKKLGMTVCITDHHLPSSTPPDADCIVNPQLNKKSTEGVNLAGVGVAFYVMAALRTRMGRTADIRMSDYLDLVAIGTIADCVRLDKINRTLVGGGLEKLRKGRGGMGITALMQQCDINPSDTNCRDISHKLAPRLNAAGRFSKPELSVECLLSESQSDAKAKAKALGKLNSQRVVIIETIMKQIPDQTGKPAIVAHDETWPPGVTGIVAGRLADMYGCPAIAFCLCDGEWRGSGRVPAGGWDLHSLVSAAAKLAGEAVLRFGGHKRAIGITVSETESFAAAFEECCKNHPPEPWCREVDELPPADEITSEAIAFLEKMVWGTDFPRPLFAGDFTIINKRSMGDGTHWRFNLQNDDITLPALAFNRDTIAERAKCVFSLSIDKYSGKVTAIIDEMLS